jgi:sugar (pentulose or hexulose) kinase
VDPAQFPEVMEGHRVQGEVTAEAAEATGLRAGTPVMAGTVDSPSAALEAGVVEPGIAVEMTGTSTVVIIPNDRGLTEPALIAMPHALPGIHLLLGAMVSSGGCLRWFRDQLGSPRCRPPPRARDRRIRSADAAGGAGGAGQRGGDLPPVHDGGTLAACGIPTPAGCSSASRWPPKAALVRSILEGAAFALRHNVEVAARAGAEVREMRSVGGCSRSDLWNQIKADVLGMPVLLPRTSVGSPFGAAILAGMGPEPFPTCGNRCWRWCSSGQALRAEPGESREVHADLPGVSGHLRAPEGRLRSRGRHHPVNLLQELDGSLHLGRGVPLATTPRTGDTMAASSSSKGRFTSPSMAISVRLRIRSSRWTTRSWSAMNSISRRE